MLLLLYNLFFLFFKFICMVVCWSCESPFDHFCSSVEEVGQSEPSGHSWRKLKTHTYFYIYIYMRFFSEPLTFTCSRSGRPGRDFCEEKACKLKYKLTSTETFLWNTNMCGTASHLPNLLHLIYGLGPVLHVLLWGGVGGTLDRENGG